MKAALIPTDWPISLRNAAIDVHDWASKKPEINCIWLFGSRVRGDFKEHSDLDIAVGLKGPTGHFTFWMCTKPKWINELRLIVPWDVDLQLLSHETERMQDCIADSGHLLVQRFGCDCSRWILC